MSTCIYPPLFLYVWRIYSYIMSIVEPNKSRTALVVLIKFFSMRIALTDTVTMPLMILLIILVINPKFSFHPPSLSIYQFPFYGMDPSYNLPENVAIITLQVYIFHPC